MIAVLVLLAAIALPFAMYAYARYTERQKTYGEPTDESNRQ